MIVDIGTGDGLYVYRSARANPNKFYIGIDVQRKGMQKVSEKIHRKPEKGGSPNVLFFQAASRSFLLSWTTSLTRSTSIFRGEAFSIP